MQCVGRHINYEQNKNGVSQSREDSSRQASENRCDGIWRGVDWPAEKLRRTLNAKQCVCVHVCMRACMLFVYSCLINKRFFIFLV